MTTTYTRRRSSRDAEREIALGGETLAMGMITMIDRDKVRPTMVHGVPVWGWSYRRVGFVEVGETKVRRRLVLQLEPGGMPAPVPARPRSMHGAPLFDGVAG